MTAVDRPLQTRRVSKPSGRAVAAVGLLLVVAIPFLWVLVNTKGLLTSDNLTAILAASAVVGIVAVGQTLIMLSGSFVSLSLGTISAAGAMVFLATLQNGVVVAVVLALLFGFAASGIQGLAIGGIGANPIVLTIAAAALIQEGGVLITGGQSVLPGVGSPSVSFLVDPALGVPGSAWVFLGSAVLAGLYLKRTRSGATVYLVGANRRAAVAAGLPAASTIALSFAMAGACAGIAGVLIGALQQSASFGSEGTLTFDSIAAVLVGGTAVAGGRGSVVRTVLGTLAIAALSSSLVLRGYSGGTQILLEGAVVIVAVVAVHLWETRDTA